MTTDRQGMIDDLCETFAGISVAKGFNCSVARVERVWRPLQDSAAKVRPWVGLEIGQTLPTYRASSKVRLVTRINAIVMMDAKDENEQAERISDMDDDIWVALHQDISRGGFATYTQIVTVEGNEGDFQVGTRLAMLAYEIDVIQHRKTTLTTRR